MLPVALSYFRLLWGVPPFFIDYGFLHGGSQGWLPVLAGLLLILVGIAAIIVCLRRQSHDMIGIGLLWVGLLMLPVSNVVPMMQYMAERFLYLPLVGWLILCAAFLNQSRFGTPLRMLCFLILLLWAGLALNRSFIWRNDLTLFVTSSRNSPPNARLERNAVKAMLREPHIASVLQPDPDNPSSRNPDWAAVFKTLDTLQELYPGNELVLMAAGMAQVKRSKLEEAINSFTLASERNPSNLHAWSNLGRACVNAKQYDRAESALQKALGIDSRHVPTLESLARVHWHHEEYESARDTYERILAINSQNRDASYWMKRSQEALVGPANE